MSKKLQKSKTNIKLSGMLGGIAEYFDIDPAIVRILFIVLDVMTGIVPLAIIYGLAVLVID